jgi:hypothetical protein
VTTTRPSAKKKPFASSILLWMRTGQPRLQGMDHWKGPHSKIISVTPGFDEYRQIHLAENNPGLWPAISGVETVIPAERRTDGVAAVTGGCTRPAARPPAEFEAAHHCRLQATSEAA